MNNAKPASTEVCTGVTKSGFSFRADTPESAVPMWMGMRDGMYMRLVTVVPEPATPALLLGGLLFGAVVRRVRRLSSR